MHSTSVSSRATTPSGNAPAASKLTPSTERLSNEPVHISTLMPELLARADSRRRSASAKRRRGLSQ